MPYQAETWIPRPRPFDVYKIELHALEELKQLLGATNVRSAYVRDGTVVVEWTMMHREEFFGLVGQYIMRNDRGEFKVVDKSELRSDFQPFIEDIPVVHEPVHPILGKIVAVGHDENGVINEVLFQLPDGTPERFVTEKEPAEVEDIDLNPVAVISTDPDAPNPAITPSPKVFAKESDAKPNPLVSNQNQQKKNNQQNRPKSDLDKGVQQVKAHDN